MRKLLLFMLVCFVGLPFAAQAVVPAVSIVSSKGTVICSGDTVVFTATPTNGGTSPSYQWKVNGSNAGANSATFSTTSLSNGDMIWCVLTSNDPLANPTTANSDTITMTVNTRLTPIVAISLSPNDTICDGTTVTFTATYANGGSTPSFQWKLNGANVGGDSAKYITSTLADGDVVSCILTSSETCVTAATDTSNSITMKVNPILTPVVNITVSPNDTICANTFTTFTATTSNGGSSPTYQWRRNGVVVGSNSSTYSTNTLANGDNVLCILTSSETCVSKTRDTSDSITMTVRPNLVPSVSITVSPNDTVCAGTPLTFTATPVNGGSSPVYTWRVNGSIVGGNSPTLNVSLSVNSTVWCTMASSEQCKTSSLVFSNFISMRVNAILTPDVNVTVSPNDTICAGTMTTFTASPVNGGTTPSYQWQLNGINAGTNSNTYSSSTLSSGDQVRVIMTSSWPCLTKPDDTSASTTMTVIPNVTPVVVITRAPSDTICEGTNITFSATSANGGTAPVYQWQVNGVNTGTNSTTFNSSTLSNGDVVRCIMNSSITCVTKAADTSNELTIGVKVKSEPNVVISVSPDDTACAGSLVTFTAASVHAGPTPTYQWQVNGGDVGTNSATFATTSLTNGAVVRCILTTSDTCVTKNIDTSNSITMVIKPILTPDVTISVSPNDTICSGDQATFTATPTNGGITPIYQWRVNGVNAGSNSATFATTLSDGDVVDCILTTSEQCVSKTMDTSTSITITVLPKVTPDVQIVVLPNDTICDGTNVTFVATPINGGTTPVYQWQVNGINVGTNATSYSSTALANGDVVRVIMTSSEPCVTKAADTSNEITMTVNPNLTPDVTITVSPNDTICVGTNVTFTASISNGGTSPVYQWRVNGSNVGSNSNTYASSALADNDVVDVILTSSEVCVTKSMDTSNAIMMEVKPYITPDVTITVSPNDTVCDGTNVTFTATPTNGGDMPEYQWQINGSNIGSNSSTYSTTALVNNDAVRVILTSSEMCLTKTMDTSNVINMTVNPNLTPDVSITVSPDDTVCAGTTVVFLANAVNGGTSPVYQWKLNGNNVGINSSGYTSNSFVTGDVITCVLTTSHTCVTKTMDTSNAVTMTVNALTTPGITISSNTGTSSCVNGEVTFTAVPVNGGTSQSYQWRLNGVDISGANSTTYMTSSLSTGDVVSCRLDITATCPSPDSAVSNGMVMNIVAPSASIAVLPNDTICENQSALFSVTGTNVGNSPIYQWMLNGVDQVGVTGTIFTMNTVGHQDVISIEFTGSDNCINAPVVPGSNTITMTVNPTAAPTVGIAANPGAILTNSDIVWFTASVNTPNVTYQWRKNGVDIPGATGLTYTDLDPQHGDSFSLWVQTTDSCRTPDTAVSNVVVLSVGVGVEEVKGVLFDNINLAPNPNNGTFLLKGKLATGRSDEQLIVEVVNAVGAVIYKEEVQVQNYELNTRIELGDKAHNGLHMVRIIADGKVHTLKFITNR